MTSPDEYRYREDKPIKVATARSLVDIEVIPVTENGEPGYIFRIGSSKAFLHEAEADDLARYLLFTEDSQE